MLEIFQIDAFASAPFTGNPAAVCLLESPLPDTLLQSIAMEMNLSETVFLSRLGEETFQIRWFTPATEVKLCGHATLASAHFLWEQGHVSAERITFMSLSGPLHATRQGDMIALDFPLLRGTAAPHANAAVAEAIGAPVLNLVCHDDWLVEVADAETVRRLTPDLAKIAALDARGLIVTARDEHYDFISRFFAPREDIPEDPVTGSAHCLLAPFWQEKLGKSTFHAYQASKRGGELWVDILSPQRVQLRGHAITVMKGTLYV
jgi:PhzF family phenazine biosynthesis protein